MLYIRSSDLIRLFVVIQLLNCVQLFETPWTAACQASLSFTVFWRLLKIMSTEMPSNHLILCLPLLLPSIHLIAESLYLFVAF